MFMPIKVIDVELSHPLTDITNLTNYRAVKALVRLYGRPIGYVEISVTNGRCTAATLASAIIKQHAYAIVRCYLLYGMAVLPEMGLLTPENLLQVIPDADNGAWPLVTVAVCTRDRTENLSLCLEGLSKLDYPNLEILVVDNAPVTEGTDDLVCTNYPHVRYICEPRPGLNWARNRAILEARGEIIAYTDDDVTVDPGWVKALARVFVADPEVMAVTGLVVPYELESEAQLLFEEYGGFGRGFQRKWYQLDRESRDRWWWYGAGSYGTGANMAYRRSLFRLVGLFDPAMDVGTPTNGGGDLEMFFRILIEGYILVYEPAAVVRHHHRHDYDNLREQIRNNGIGLSAYHMRSAMAYPSERLAFLKLGLYWLYKGYIRRLVDSFLQPGHILRELVLAELWGSLIGLGRYRKARLKAQEIAKTLGSLAEAGMPNVPVVPKKHTRTLKLSAVRIVDLGESLRDLKDVTDYESVRVIVTWHDRLLGEVYITNYGCPVSVIRLREAIVDSFGLKLLEPERQVSSDILWSRIEMALAQRYGTEEKFEESITPIKLAADVSVSVVVATHDRPDDLRKCLQGLVAQETLRPVEIIVVDNNPASGLTPPVVAEFRGTVLVTETRKGLSYARNAGITNSSGDLVVCTDDDVVIPPTWLERLVTPFARSDVMIVTGNTLPWQLDTPSQCFFERYGGLGRGFERLEVNKDWFDSHRYYAVPTWTLGATANAAFRATIFNHPQIGLLDEALGAGSPTGCSEDTYIFYQVLKAGYTLCYEPTAYLWHKHRQSMPALRRQLYNYSKGGVAYHLTTFLRDRDLRGLFQVAVHLPIWQAGRIMLRGKNLLTGKKNDYPLSLILMEVVGNLMGPWALWRSRRRVKRLGHSAPYVPVAQRSTSEKSLLLEVHQLSTNGSQQTEYSVTS